VAVSVSVTMTQVNEDGSESPVDGELSAALAGPAERFSEMIAWAARDAAGADHGERETVIGESGRELQRQLLEATFTIDCPREERVTQVTSAATGPGAVTGNRHGAYGRCRVNASDVP
jgi:hypothetical protein